MCIEEAPSLWPPGTVCQRGTWGWAQSNASSWHCAYDTSNNLNYVQQTFMHVFDLFSSCMCSCLIYVHIRFPERRVLPLLWCNASCCLSVVFRFNCTHNKLFFFLVCEFFTYCPVLISTTLDIYLLGWRSLWWMTSHFSPTVVSFGSALSHI